MKPSSIGAVLLTAARLVQEVTLLIRQISDLQGADQARLDAVLSSLAAATDNLHQAAQVALRGK